MKYNEVQVRTVRRWKQAGKTEVEIMDITGIKLATVMKIYAFA